MIHEGIILAAGASSRMGRPKALLPTPEGLPLAAHQRNLLVGAGCRRVVVVLGAEYKTIRDALPHCETVWNPRWEEGRSRSLAVGLSATPACEGVLILPVDTVGVRIKTLQVVLKFADQMNVPALRPTHQGRDGKVLWLSRETADRFLSLASSAQPPRMDHWIKSLAVPLEVEDSAIESNINTPADWTQALAHWTQPCAGRNNPPPRAPAGGKESPQACI